MEKKEICITCLQHLVGTDLNLVFANKLKLCQAIDEVLFNDLYAFPKPMEERARKILEFVTTHKRGRNFHAALNELRYTQFAQHYVDEHDTSSKEYETEVQCVHFSDPNSERVLESCQYYGNEKTKSRFTDVDSEEDDCDQTSNDHMKLHVKEAFVREFESEPFVKPQEKAELDSSMDYTIKNQLKNLQLGDRNRAFDQFDNSACFATDYYEAQRRPEYDVPTRIPDSDNEVVYFDASAEQVKACRQDEEGNTPLHVAIDYRRHDALLRLIALLPSWVFTCIRNNFGELPIHRAVLTKQANCVRDLLRYGSVPDTLDNNGDTPLHIACRKGSNDCVLMLLTPIQEAEKKGHLNYEVPYPILPQANLNIRNHNGLTCFHEAAKWQRREILLMLRKAGADVNFKDAVSGYTALHHAVSDRKEAIVKCLLEECRVDVNARDFAGKTPLNLCDNKDDPDSLSIKQLLLTHNAVLSSDTEEESDREDEEMPDENEESNPPNSYCLDATDP